MTVSVRSFAKINLGLYIGALRPDGFHELRTVYQTIALHDVIRVSVGRGSGIETRCDDPRVPLDSSNTCHHMASLVMKAMEARGKVTIEIEKRLPVQGGLGAASSNAVATLVGLEAALKQWRVVKKPLNAVERLRIAASVGSDLPLFLIGGTVLGVGRGEEVYPLADLASTAMVVVTPELGVSTPRAFADWNALVQGDLRSGAGRSPVTTRAGTTPTAAKRARSAQTHQLTAAASSDKLFEVGCVLSAWLSCYPDAGAPAKSGGRAGNLLSDLVRTGIENDFEKVVFPQSPELRDMKCALERAGSRYASLSGSGSSLYGLFRSPAEAVAAAGRLRQQGLRAVATRTLTRRQYWRSGFRL